jgi:hypothetical protein
MAGVVARASLGMACVLGLGTLATGARADWEYTRWGMTPDQVVAASGGAVGLGAPPEGKTYERLEGLARGRHQVDGATFDAYFHFDQAGGLAKVALERTGGTACTVLLSQMMTRYGNPERSTRTNFATIETWRDATRKNLVRYVLVGELPCTITFDRLN